MTPMDFAKGFVLALRTKGIERLDVNSREGRTGLNAAYTVVESTVKSFTGNAAKSPRYRDWLKVKTTIAPGFMDEFGGFRNELCLSIMDLRKKTKDVSPLAVSEKDAQTLLKAFEKEDRTVIENAAKAFVKNSKTKNT